jgi:hypothetical protein
MVRILFKPWVLALLPTVVAILLLPQSTGKNSLEVAQSSLKNDYVSHADLDGDGTSERIIAGEGAAPYNMVAVQNSEGNWFDQWNIFGKYHPKVTRIFVGDFDQDKLCEIYIFSIRRDSLFLNVNEFFDTVGVHIEQLFVTRLGFVKNEITSETHSIGFFDSNGDGLQEYYFGITTGFGLAPRLLYSFNIKDRSLVTSPYTSININSPEMNDIDSDGRPELYGRVNASGNHHFKTPYSDYSTWIMVFDDQFQFKFKPIEFPGFGNSLKVQYLPESERILVNFSHGHASAESPKSQLLLYSPDGKRINSKLLSDYGLSSQTETITLQRDGRNVIALLSNPAIILDDNLAEIDKQPLSIDEPYVSYVRDLDDDGLPEVFLLSSAEKKALVYSSDLKVLYGELSVDSYEPWYFSALKDERGKTINLLSIGNNHRLIQVKINNWYWVGYLIYPGIYTISVMFVLLVMHVNAWQVKKNETVKRRIQELQLASIKSKLDPHFTFNALNAIGSMLKLEDRNVAYDYLTRFTRMLRQLITDSDRLYRPLSEELKFVSDYLTLEKMRFDEKFNFSIETCGELSGDELVPIMCVQIFAENSLRHGIMPMKKDGIILISTKRIDDDLIITIEDNGIGRKLAAANGPNLGKGIRLTREFYTILSESTPREVTFDIEDMPVGTRVRVRIPVNAGS